MCACANVSLISICCSSQRGTSQTGTILTINFLVFGFIVVSDILTFYCTESIERARWCQRGTSGERKETIWKVCLPHNDCVINKYPNKLPWWAKCKRCCSKCFCGAPPHLHTSHLHTNTHTLHHLLQSGGNSSLLRYQYLFKFHLFKWTIPLSPSSKPCWFSLMRMPSRTEKPKVQDTAQIIFLPDK